MNDYLPIKRVLISVYDKKGLIELGEKLSEYGVEIVSTGSTAKKLMEAAIPVTTIEQVTGFPECLDGRVKTLHPKVHAGILADRRLPSHRKQLGELEIEPFDLVVSNLYPFEATVDSGGTETEIIEQIDIGGPSMVRAAAKNYANIAVITSTSQYQLIFTALKNGGFSLAERKELACAAFVHTATYDIAVSNWFTKQRGDLAEADFPYWMAHAWDKITDLRYGENSHQKAALYRDTHKAQGIASAVQLHGKEMSYNNYVDADAALRAAYDFVDPAVAVIKHTNPCGIALGSNIAEAHRLANATDPVSAFGGVIAANREVSVEMAEQVAKIFTEVVIAPGYESGAVEILSRKKNIRVLLSLPPAEYNVEMRPITGGILVQARDQLDALGDHMANWELVAGATPDEFTKRDLVFAWKACRSVKSNAILLAKDQAAVGIGMGQVNRVDSCHLAVQRAGQRAIGSVAASDAFFPFADGPQILIDAKVSAIVQPGGSMRDQETIDLCRKSGTTLYLTKTRHFFH